MYFWLHSIANKENHNWFLLHFLLFLLFDFQLFYDYYLFNDYKITHTNVHMLITISQWDTQLNFYFIISSFLSMKWWSYEIWCGHMCCINYEIKIIISLETCLSRLFIFSLTHFFYYLMKWWVWVNFTK